MYKKFLPLRLIKISQLKSFTKETIFKKKTHLLKEFHLDVAKKAKMYADGYEEPEGYCVKLENIFFYSDSGLLQHKDKIIEESGMDLKRIVSMKNVYKKIIGYNPKIKNF